MPSTSQWKSPSIGVMTIMLRAPVSFFATSRELRACYGMMRLYAPPGIVQNGEMLTCVRARLLLDPDEEMLYCFIAGNGESFSFPLSDVRAIFAGDGKQLWPVASA